MTALAASIGTGNIAGVATAIVSGGPGALFWIWVYGFVATAIKFAEAVLGVTFRETRGDACCRARCTTCATASRSPVLAWLFAFVAGGRGADDDALHAAELDGAGAEHRRRRPAVGVGHRDCRADLARDHRRHQVDRPRGREALAAQGRSVSRRRARRHPRQRGSHSRRARAWSSAKRSRTQSRAGLRHVRRRCATASRAASTPTRPATAPPPSPTAPRRATQPAQQGLNAVMEVFIVSFVTSTISAMTILLTGAWRVGPDEHRRRRRGVQHGDARRRRVDRRVLRVPLRLHDAHRLGLLRRAVLRVHPRPRGRRCPIAGSTAC